MAKTVDEIMAEIRGSGNGKGKTPSSTRTNGKTVADIMSEIRSSAPKVETPVVTPSANTIKPQTIANGVMDALTDATRSVTSRKIEIPVSSTQPVAPAKQENPRFTDYSSAVKYLNDKGVVGAAGIMTENEWRRRKESTGTNSYDAYLEKTVANIENGNSFVHNKAYVDKLDEDIAATDKEIASHKNTLGLLRTPMEGIIDPKGITDKYIAEEEEAIANSEAKLAQQKAERKSKGNIYATLPQEQDFDKFSAGEETPAITDTFDRADMLFAAVNGHNDFIEEHKSAPRGTGRKHRPGQTLYFDDVEAAKYFLPDEKRIFNYLYNKYGKGYANAYFDYMNDTLNERYGKARAEETDTFGEYAGLTIESGAAQFLQGAEQLFDNDAITTPASMYAAQNARSKLNGVGKVAFDVTQTVSNMVPSLAVGAINPIAGATLMGASASGNAYNEKIKEGYSVAEARTYSVLVGASEVLTQSLLGGIGAFGGAGMKALAKFAPKIAKLNNVFGKVAKNVGGSFVGRSLSRFALSGTSESIEEGLQPYIAAMFASLVFNEDYKAPEIEEVAYSMLLGFLSGGLIEGTMGTVTDLNTQSLGKELKTDAVKFEADTLGVSVAELDAVKAKTAEKGIINAIIEEGLASDENSYAYKIAVDLQEKVANGETISNYDLGKLYGENVRFYSKNPDEAEITEAPAVDPLAQAAKEAISLTQAPITKDFGAYGKSTFSDLRKQFPNVPVEELADSFNTAYEAGRLNTPMEKVQLVNDIQRMAYNAGRMDYIVSDTEADIKRNPLLSDANNYTSNMSFKKGKPVLTDVQKTLKKQTGYGEYGTKTLYDIVTHDDSIGFDQENFDQVKSRFHNAYIAGFVDLPSKAVSLTTDLQRVAFEAGKRDAIISKSANDANVRYATVHGKESGFVMTDAAQDVDQATVRLLNDVAKAMGIKAMFEETLVLDNGAEANAQMGDDGIFKISKTAENPVVTLVAHELVHRMRQFSTNEYYAFRNFAVQHAEQLGFRLENGINGGTNFEYIQDQYQSKNMSLEMEAAIDEIAARFAEKLITDGKEGIEQIRSMMEGIEAEIEANPETSTETKSALKRFIGWLQEIWHKLTGIATNLNKEGRTAEAEKVQEVADAIGPIIKEGQRLWGEAYRGTKKAVEGHAKTEKTATTNRGGVSYDIAVLEDGKVYVSANRKVIVGKTKSEQRKNITDFFKKLLEGQPSLDIQTIEGDVLTITKAQTAKKARDDYKEIKGQRMPLTDEEFAVKLRVESHIDEIVEISQKVDERGDEKNHSFAQDGFTYRRAHFEDIDGQYYEITLSIGHEGKTATVYNVGKINESVIPSAKIIAVVGSRPLGTTLSKKRIPQTSAKSQEENKNSFSLKDSTDKTLTEKNEGNSTEGTRWVVENDVLTKTEQATFWRKLAEITKLGYNARKTVDGGYVVDVGQKLVFTDGSFENPRISRVIELTEEYEENLVEIKEWIYDEARHETWNGETLRIIETLQEFGDAYERVPADYRSNGRETERGAGTDSSRDHQGTSNEEEYSLKGLKPIELLTREELIEKYGAIPAGENPFRGVQVPRKSSDDKKVSQTVRTILEAEATPDEALPTIEQLVTEGEFSYDVYTDKAAISEATAELEKGYTVAFADWLKSVEKGIVSKKNTAMGWALYNNAVNNGDMKTAMTILNKMVQHQRNAAQALQATRILKKLSPEGQLYQAVNSVESLQKELTERYGDKAPDLTIDPELAETLLSAETQEERDLALREIYKSIGRQMPSRFIDKWNAWRYLSMLGNPKTHIRNILGNALFTPVVMAKDFTAAAIENAVYRVSDGKLQKSKAAVLGNKAGRTLLKAAWADFDNVQDVMSGHKYDDHKNANKHIEDGRTVFRFKLLEAARKGNSNLLELEDMWFSRPHYAYALAQYCKANNITAEQIANGKAIKPARVYAIREAQKATYRDANALSQMVSNLGRSGQNDNKLKKWASALAEGILPFRRTPANILVRGLEYSPAGLLKSLTHDLIQVKQGKMSGAEAIDNISAGLTGTGLFTLGFWLAAEGLLRGKGGDDEEKNEFEELMGHQEYSLELPGGMSITLDWIAPESLPLFMGVNLYELTKNGKEEITLATVLTALQNVAEPMMSMSVLQSLNDVSESVGRATTKGMSGIWDVPATALTSYITQAIPSFLGQLERSSQPERMTTHTTKDSFLTSDVQYTLGRISSRVPGVDYNQIPYIDAWGRKETEENVLGRVASEFLNPAYVSKVKESKMEKELLRLYEKTGDSAVLPSRAGKYFSVNGERIDLTKEKYVRYATLKGSLSYKIVSELTSSSGYNSLSDSEKTEAVAEAYKYANQKAKSSVSSYEPDKWVKNAEKGSKYGVSVSDYIIFKNGVNDLESGVDYSEGKTGARKQAIRRLLNDMGLSGQAYRYLLGTEYKS